MNKRKKNLNSLSVAFAVYVMIVSNIRFVQRACFFLQAAAAGFFFILNVYTILNEVHNVMEMRLYVGESGLSEVDVVDFASSSAPALLHLCIFLFSFCNNIHKWVKTHEKMARELK